MVCEHYVVPTRIWGLGFPLCAMSLSTCSCCVNLYVCKIVESCVELRRIWWALCCSVIWILPYKMATSVIHSLQLEVYMVCGAYMVTLLNWTPIFG